MVPHIRLVDWSPSRKSLLCPREVERGDKIGVMLESTFVTSEKGLSSSIGLVDISAPWACFGGVSRVGIEDGYPPFEGLISNKVLELLECPTVEIPVLALSMLGSVSDSSQLFHDYYVVLSEAVYKFSADLMQKGVNPSPLLSTKPFQLPLCGGCAFSLERRTMFSKTLSLSEGGFPLNLKTVRSNQETIDANIDAHGISSFRFWNYLVNGDVEKEGFVSVNQHGMRWLNILKKLPLVFSDIECRFHPLLNRGDRCVDSIGLVDKPEESLIQIYRKLSEPQKPISPLFVGFSHSISGSNGKVCWKAEPSPCFSINHVVEGNWVKHSPFKSHLRNIVTRIAISLKGSKQLLRIFSGRLKLADNGLRELHQIAYMLFKYLSIKPQFLPALKDGVSLRWFR